MGFGVGEGEELGQRPTYLSGVQGLLLGHKCPFGNCHSQLKPLVLAGCQTGYAVSRPG